MFVGPWRMGTTLSSNSDGSALKKKLRRLLRGQLSNGGHTPLPGFLTKLVDCPSWEGEGRRILRRRGSSPHRSRKSPVREGTAQSTVSHNRVQLIQRWGRSELATDSNQDQQR